jgi:hypothetical protein
LDIHQPMTHSHSPSDYSNHTHLLPPPTSNHSSARRSQDRLSNQWPPHQRLPSRIALPPIANAAAHPYGLPISLPILPDLRILHINPGINRLAETRCEALPFNLGSNHFFNPLFFTFNARLVTLTILFANPHCFTVIFAFGFVTLTVLLGHGTFAQYFIAAPQHFFFFGPIWITNFAPPSDIRANPFVMPIIADFAIGSPSHPLLSTQPQQIRRHLRQGGVLVAPLRPKVHIHPSVLFLHILGKRHILPPLLLSPTLRPLNTRTGRFAKIKLRLR